MKHIRLKFILGVILIAVIGVTALSASLGEVSVSAFSASAVPQPSAASYTAAPAQTQQPSEPAREPVLPYELSTGFYTIDAVLENFMRKTEESSGILSHSIHRYSETGLGVVFELSGGGFRALQFSSLGMNPIPLAKLFVRDSDYIGLIHDLSLEELTERGKTFEQAAALLSYNEDDYQNYVLDGGELIIYFDFAAGRGEEISVPVASLEDIWNGGGLFEKIRLTDGVEPEEQDDGIMSVAAIKSSLPDYSLIEPSFTKREDGKKYIALTFDDGPNPICTPILLDMLAKNDAKATFFMLGQRASLMPDIVKRVASEGHEIGNHSYNHLELTRLSGENLRLQVAKTNDEIYDITGEVVHLLRPPYGSRNQNVIDSAVENDMAIIIWDIDPQDWKKSGPDAIANHVINRAKDGSIILLHDIYRDSVNAAEKILIELKNQGYEFLTVSDLIHMNCGLEYGSVYRDSKGTVTK